MKPITPTEALKELQPIIQKINTRLNGLSINDFPRQITLEMLGLSCNTKNLDFILDLIIKAYRGSGWWSFRSTENKTILIFSIDQKCLRS